MAAKKRSAITGLHSQGIVDDVLIPIAKKVIRVTTKGNKTKGLAKEVKLISTRHEKLLNDRRASQVYNKSSAVKKTTKKINKNMQSGSKTARDYKVGTAEAGLPTGAHSIGRKKTSNPKYADYLTERALKKTGRIGGDELMSIGRRSTRSSVKKAYPMRPDLDAKVVKQMRREKLIATKRNKKGK